MCPLGGNEAAHLREDCDQRVLPQEGGFAGHIGTGEEPDTACAGLRRWREIAVIGDERRAVARQRLLHDHMTATVDSECMAVVDLRPYVVALDGKMRER